MNPEEFKRSFLQDLSEENQLTTLFNQLPDIYFFMKNIENQFVMCNRAFSEKCGVHGEQEVIGKTDFDFFPNDLARNYVKDDKEVMDADQKIINRVELVPNDDGTIDWHSTNKEPLYSKDGSVMGLAGTTRNLKKAGALLHPYMEMSDIIEYISSNYRNHIDIGSLARMASLSVSQFERKFKSIFQLSPVGFVIKVRIKAACKELINTRDTISNIARKMGFYDQSHFSKQFTRHMGMSPRNYRKQYFRGKRI